MSSVVDADTPTSLNRQIDIVARRLAERRLRVAADAARLRQTFRRRLVSPGMLLAAVGVGIALEQSKRRRQWSLLSALNAFNAGATLLATISRPAKPEPPSRGAPYVR
jgi:hypothetical protein